MGSKWLMHINQVKFKREDVRRHRGLTLKLQCYRPLLFDAKGIEHFLHPVAFVRCCTGSQSKFCAGAEEQQECLCLLLP